MRKPRSNGAAWPSREHAKVRPASLKSEATELRFRVAILAFRIENFKWHFAAILAQADVTANEAATLCRLMHLT